MGVCKGGPYMRLQFFILLAFKVLQEDQNNFRILSYPRLISSASCLAAT